MENDNNNKSKGTRLFREVIKKRSEDGSLILYIIEVHEDESDHEYFVNLRHITANRTNVSFPISLSKAVIDKLLESKEIVNDKPVFKLEKICSKSILSSDSKYSVEIKSENNSEKRILHGGPVNEDENSDKDKPWHSKGSVELNTLIIARLIKNLVDIMVRYQTISKLPEALSLYSSSGGRRFYFDVRETRWGKRVQISQLTQKRRNTIGVPLENLIQFRDHLDHFIKELSLEENSNLISPGKRVKKTSRRGPPRPRRMKGSKVPVSKDGEGLVEPAPSSMPAEPPSSAANNKEMPIQEVQVQ